MKNEIKQKFPKWCNEENMKNMKNMCLSDDIDSLFSCIVLKKLFPDLQINLFYNFDNMYKTNVKNIKKCFGVDTDLVRRKCWGNHVSVNNPLSANLNTILGINRDNYYKKFAGSTLLTIISFYDFDLSNLSEEQKMVLLTIDSTYMMYRNPNFKYIGKYWINDILGYKELDDILEKHSQDEFLDITKKYKLDGKIWVNNDGKLNTDIKIDKLQELFPNLSFNLPKNQFNLHKTFEIIQSSYIKHDKKDVFSLARTYKNSLRYSIK